MSLISGIQACITCSYFLFFCVAFASFRSSQTLSCCTDVCEDVGLKICFYAFYNNLGRRAVRVKFNQTSFHLFPHRVSFHPCDSPQRNRTVRDELRVLGRKLYNFCPVSIFWSVVGIVAWSTYRSKSGQRWRMFSSAPLHKGLKSHNRSRAQHSNA